MAAPIRPSLPLPTPARASGPSDAARAAQRAFFSQALNSAQAPAPIAETAPLAPVQRRAEVRQVEAVSLPDQPPQRPLRPGSLLDIKI